MTTSERAAPASSYVISGSGFASTKTIGCFAIELTISRVTTLATLTPTKTSAPVRAWASVLALVFWTKGALYGL